MIALQAEDITEGIIMREILSFRRSFLTYLLSIAKMPPSVAKVWNLDVHANR